MSSGCGKRTGQVSTCEKAIIRGITFSNPAWGLLCWPASKLLKSSTAGLGEPPKAAGTGPVCFWVLSRRLGGGLGSTGFGFGLSFVNPAKAMAVPPLPQGLWVRDWLLRSVFQDILSVELTGESFHLLNPLPSTSSFHPPLLLFLLKSLP